MNTSAPADTIAELPVISISHVPGIRGMLRSGLLAPSTPNPNNSHIIRSNEVVRRNGHRIQMRTPCPATTVLGIRDTAYQAVDISFVNTVDIGIANPSKPNA